MIFNHNPISAAVDMENFLEITKRRQRLIDAAPDSLPSAPYAVNALAARLHPETVNLMVAAKTPIAEGMIALDFKPACGGALPFFRAGQSVCIRARHNGGLFVQPYPLSSPPIRALDGEWSVIVSDKCQSPVTRYLFEIQPGDTVEASSPEGFMYYSPLRDAKKVIFIADETGIGAALSMAAAVESELSVYLESEKDFSLPFANHRLNDVSDALRGADENSPVSVFICGRSDLYDRVRPAAEEILKRQKFIRFQLTDGQGETADGESFNCRVLIGFDSFDIKCFSGETLLVSLERAGVPTKARCRSGECGYCRCKLVSGKVKTDFRPESDSRRAADIKYGVIHPCRSYPETDIILEF